MQTNLVSRQSMGVASSLPATSRQSLDEALARIMPTPQSETRIQRARRVMGSEVAELSDAALAESLTGFQYLLDQWCDEFERTIFEGKTLKETYVGV